MLQVLDESGEVDSAAAAKKKEIAETEDLHFLLKSGIVLCQLANRIVPNCQIDLDNLPVGNLNTKRRNTVKFLEAARCFGVPEEFLFKPDDLVMQCHSHK